MGEMVSIITPMYNAQKYIADTMDSVLAQTYQNWEMIIMDDCSTDGGPDIVKEYSAKDSRIRYFRNERNQGVSKTRNAAMQKASGRYLAFLDSDDLWDADKLNVQIKFMRENDAHFTCTGCRIIDEDGQPTGQVRHIPAKKDYSQMLKGNSAACLTGGIVILRNLRSALEEKPQICVLPMIERRYFRKVKEEQEDRKL